MPLLPDPVPERTKVCRQCHATKSLSKFRKNSNSDNGYYHICLVCLRQVWHGRLPTQHIPRGAATKRCARCKAVKPLSCFSESTSGRLCSYCKECNKLHLLTHYLWRRYGLTVEQYEGMLAKQKGVCAICGKPETSKHPGSRGDNIVDGVPRLSVDHDHETNTVRGLLCYRCNHFVGYIERFGLDGVDKVIRYLRKHSR
jgi:hypothetical protein